MWTLMVHFIDELVQRDGFRRVKSAAIMSSEIQLSAVILWNIRYVDVLLQALQRLAGAQYLHLQIHRPDIHIHYQFSLHSI